MVEVYFALYGGSNSTRPEQILRVLVRSSGGDLIERWEGNAGWRAHHTAALLERAADGRCRLVGYERGDPVQVSWEQVKPLLREELGLMTPWERPPLETARGADDERAMGDLTRLIQSMDSDLRRFLLNLAKAPPETREDFARRLHERADDRQLAQLLTDMESDGSRWQQLAVALETSPISPDS